MFRGVTPLRSSDVTRTTGDPGAQRRPGARVAVVIGTRPEAIKLAPVCWAFEEIGVGVAVVLTGQHRELVDELLGPLEIAHLVDENLDVMRHRQRLNVLAGATIDGLGEYFWRTRPDAVVVQGDTTSAFCGSLAAFYEQIPVAHVEAGLRSGELHDPFPEELNRQLIGRMSAWQFVPTVRAGENLVREAIPGERIELIGNTVIDAMEWVVGKELGTSAFSGRVSGPHVLVTLHRRETRGARLRAVAEAIGRSARKLGAEVVFPVHPSPDVRDAVLPVLEAYPEVQVCEPLGYFDFIATLAHADLAVSDSGGVQEEAPSLRTPVLVVRNTTERPEAIEAGCALLVGTDPHELERTIVELFEDGGRRTAMTATANPFGDGFAAKRLARRVLDDLGSVARPA